ncbi:hypothetical protein [Desulfosporosinus sp.]|uniref:LVIVD repeat-containing protein n=1 Tax=Desulfosporosinus sp. TaxID=157907 RepID=UPI0025C243ED|nr:hypothetical protein [Desulfosporosinus sp.]MBC2726098.1 hypothetical protein [Desulfosporosinus sp.]
MADGLSGLYILDVTDPYHLELLGRHDTHDYAIDVWAGHWGEFDNLAFVAANLNGLQIVDVQNPSLPSLIGSYSIPGEATGIHVSYPYVYVAAGTAGLQIIDASDPYNPILIGSFETDGYSYGLAGDDPYIYIADGNNGVVIIDAADPKDPHELANFNISLGSERDVAINNHYAYVAYDGLVVLDVSNPAHPTYTTSYRTPGVSKGVSVHEDYAFVADFSSLMILQVLP